jgi:Spy/CpxP family protein refolding chaperone
MSAAQTPERVLPSIAKGLIMTTPSPATAAAPSSRRFLFNRFTAAAFIAGAALMAGVGAWANMDGAYGAADVSAHADHMLKHFYVEVDASNAQKAQIDPIVKQAMNDLLPLHAQLQSAHEHAMQALAQPTIDRASLEAARAEHLQLADQASKRIVQLMADVGDLLTVPQRKAFAEHLQHMHRMPHS